MCEEGTFYNFLFDSSNTNFLEIFFCSNEKSIIFVIKYVVILTFDYFLFSLIQNNF